MPNHIPRGQMKLNFGRLMTAMVTPFDPQLQVNWRQVQPLIDYLIEDQQSQSLVICGTTGESPTLSEEEKLKLIQESIRSANGRCKIIAGTGSNDTAHTIYFSKQVEALGVDALLIVAPYYNRPSQEGIYQHYKAIAEAVHTPIFIYNVPSRTSVNIDADTMIRLSHIPNIIGSKDCSNLDQLSKVIDKAAPGFLVYTGEDSMTLPALCVGSYGVISVASHIIGQQMLTMINRYLQGDIHAAAALHRKLLPVFTGIFKVPSPAPIKHLLNHKGISVGGVRLPLIQVNEEEAVCVESLLEITF
jgi:4-hydroxy-tetrahydrodipicolinate synthase